VRFATECYDEEGANLKNPFVHLTNYAVNRTNQENQEEKGDGEAGAVKWSVQTLKTYFEEKGIGWTALWAEIESLSAKTILCGHFDMIEGVEEFGPESHVNCYKLFGLDVMLDSNLKPWLLEVNSHPSMFPNKTDLKVNGPLVAEMFNILGFSSLPSHENNMGGAQKNNMGGAQKNNMGGAQQNNMGGAENYSMGGASVGGIEDRDLSNQILPEETMLEKQMCDNGHSNMNRNSDFEATGVVVDLCNSTTTAELDGNGNQVFERQGNDPKIGNDDEEGGCGPRNNNEAAPLHFPTKSENQLEKEENFYSGRLNNDQLLETLTSYDTRVLIRTEDELARSDGFSRIFPDKNCTRLLDLLDLDMYSNRLLATWVQLEKAERKQILESLSSKGFHLLP